MSTETIIVYQGESRTIRLGPVIDVDTGLALDLSAPDLVEWQVKKRPGLADGDADVNILLAKSLDDASLSLESGTGSPTPWYVVIPLEPGDTAELVGRWYDDCVVVVGGQRRFVRVPSPFHVRPAVNQP